MGHAIELIRRSVDPCGGSAEIARLLDMVAHCARAKYRIRTDLTASRNSFDREGGELPRTINWNPELTQEIERGCGGDPHRVVLRDPTASLLHELAHAAQDCQGLEATDLELEAVRVENIYRRAAGLCQRSRYGDEPLPPAMRVDCVPGSCSCTAGAPTSAQHTAARADAAPSTGHSVGDLPHAVGATH